jgi:hypothetical protein
VALHAAVATLEKMQRGNPHPIMTLVEYRGHFPVDPKKEKEVVTAATIGAIANGVSTACPYEDVIPRPTR